MTCLQYYERYRNWSSLAALKQPGKNTVKWPKLHNLQHGIYIFFPGDTPRISMRLVANRNCCYYRTWDICFGTLHLAPSKEWFREDDRIHSTYLKNTKSTFKCIEKIHSLDCKFNFIDYLSLFYINALRMSDSFADVMSSLYVTCKMPVVNK